MGDIQGEISSENFRAMAEKENGDIQERGDYDPGLREVSGNGDCRRAGSSGKRKISAKEISYSSNSFKDRNIRKVGLENREWFAAERIREEIREEWRVGKRLRKQKATAESLWLLKKANAIRASA